MNKDPAFFEDRADAAHRLAMLLRKFHGAQHTLLLGLCRGGVPLARAIADELHLPMDILVVRKLSVPGNPELAMGAIAEHGGLVLNAEVLQWLAHADTAVADSLERETRELRRRIKTYRQHTPAMALQNKEVILVDDGAATGATMRAAIQAARKAGASRVRVALPVAPAETCKQLAHEADEMLCVWEPIHFLSVGGHYRHFPQVTDADVKESLSHITADAGQPV